jgi:putative membrane protein
MISLLIQWALSALLLVIMAYLIPAIQSDNFFVALIAAAVLGLVNTLIRPILGFISFPITVLSLGLFSFVINALMLGLTAFLVPGFSINGFIPALIGALLLALLNFVVELIRPKNNTQTPATK